MARLWIGWAGALILAGAGLARAATVADLEFGDPLWGEPIAGLEDLQDRTVVVYFWAAD